MDGCLVFKVGAVKKIPTKPPEDSLRFAFVEWGTHVSERKQKKAPVWPTVLTPGSFEAKSLPPIHICLQKRRRSEPLSQIYDCPPRRQFYPPHLQLGMKEEERREESGSLGHLTLDVKKIGFHGVFKDHLEHYTFEWCLWHPLRPETLGNEIGSLPARLKFRSMLYIWIRRRVM